MFHHYLTSTRRSSFRVAAIVTTVLLAVQAGWGQIHPQAMQTIDLAATAPDVELLGPSTNARFGSTVVVGDFNGDGLLDLAIAAPFATVSNSPSDVRAGAGIVYVVFGRNSFVDSQTSTSLADVTILGGLGDHLGIALAAADLNGDGHDELIIGAPGASFPGAGADAARSNTGAVFVLLGQSLTSGSTIDLGTGSANVTIYGARTGDRLGTSLAVGDAGGRVGARTADQALPDLLAGAPGSAGESANQPNGGAAYFWYGSPSVGAAQQVLDLAVSAADVTIYGGAGMMLGSSVAVGDVNGDRTGDLLLGAPGAQRPAFGAITSAQTGAVYSLFGGDGLHPAGDPTSVFEINSASPASRPTQDASFYGAADGDQFGSAVAAGDVTGDGMGDLLVGAPLANGPGGSRPGAGEAYVFSGSASTTSGARLDVAASQQTLRVYGATSGDHLGQFVAAGRYTVPGNTGRGQGLLAGAPFAQGLKGTLSIVFGGATLATTSTRDLNLDQEDLRVIGQSAGDELGSAAATGNLDGQNGFDLIVAAPFASPELRSQAGAAYILLSHTPLDNLPPSVSITANPPSGPAPLGVSFSSAASDPDGTIASYAWNFGDGATANTASATHTYTAAGQYTARLTVTDNAGSTATAQTLVTVGTSSGLSVHINANTTGGEGPLNVSFSPAATDTSGTISQWAWDFGDGSTASIQNVSHTYSTGGTFVARVTVSDSMGAVASDQVSISVSEPPVVAILSPNAGESVQIGSNLAINWTTTDPLSGADITSHDVFLSTDGGLSYSIVIGLGLSGSARSASWSVPVTLASSQARVRVVAHNQFGATGQAVSAGNFTILDPGVPIQLTAPSAHQLTFGQTVLISWQIPPTSAQLAKGFSIYLSTDGGTTFPVPIAASPTGPELGPSATQFTWTVPDVCTDHGRIMVVATDLSGSTTSAVSSADISIHDVGPSVSEGSITSGSLQLRISTDQNAVVFQDGATVQISSDASGLTFFSPDVVRIRKHGRVILVKGRIGGVKIRQFFPNGATRLIRVTNPSCGLTIVTATRLGKALLIAPSSAL